MGVHGLWQLLQPAGQQVSLESLRGKVLAVDVSVWLHQSMKGMRDKYGNTVHNAHLQFLFKRVSKLLFYGIKPVFVFDGGVPLLKLQTIAGRRHKRDDAMINKEKTAKKLLHNVIKHHAVSTVLGDGSQPVVSLPPSQRERDMFELPELLPELDHPSDNNVEDEWDDRMLQRKEIFSEYQNLNDIDVESNDFKSLPPEIQHEILSDLRDSRKQNSWANIDQLPTDSDDFSAYQVQKLMKQSKLSRKIESVRKELNSCHSDNIGEVLDENDLGTGILSNKVVSDDTTHYILIKRMSPMKNKEETSGEKRELIESECSMSEDLLQSKTIKEEMHAICANGTSDCSTDKSTNDKIECSAEKGKEVEKNASLDSTLLNTGTVAVSGPQEVEPGANQMMLNSDNTDKVNEKFGDIRDNSVEFVEQIDAERQSDINKMPKSIHNVVKDDKLSPGDTKLTLDHNMKRLCDFTSDDSLRKKPRSDLENGRGDSEEAIVCFNRNAGKVVPADIIGSSYQQTKVVNNEDDKNTDSSEDDTADFVEVTINPDTMDSADLFPASLFIPANGTVNGKTTTEFDANDTKDLLLNSETQDIGDYSQLRAVSSDSSEDLKNQFNSMSRQDLEDLQIEVEVEAASLRKEQGTQERLATSITDQMQKESQELLLLFGVPFVVSPMEAEAQCAFLDLTSQTQGTITDDSDIWLFGGKSVYRNVFNQNKYVEYFCNKDIEDRLLLTRPQMVKLAYLCGCDYTDGVQGVGPVTGLEILLEFPGDELDGLNKLKDWWTEAHTQVKCNSDTKLKKKLKTLELSEGFPNPAVYEAFMQPVVDESTDEFTWGKPDLDLLRDFAYDKLGWTKAKVDEIVLPVVKEMNNTVTQSNIPSFFKIESASKSPVKSKRVKRVLNRMKDQSTSGKKGKSSKKLPAKNKKSCIVENNTGSGWVKEDSASVMLSEGLNLSENSTDSD